MKLTRINGITSPESDTLAALLTAVSTRVLVEFEPHRESAKRIEMMLVESHMRIAFSTPTHREFFRSGTPSEPILAEAVHVF